MENIDVWAFKPNLSKMILRFLVVLQSASVFLIKETLGTKSECQSIKMSDDLVVLKVAQYLERMKRPHFHDQDHLYPETLANILYCELKESVQEYFLNEDELSELRSEDMRSKPFTYLSAGALMSNDLIHQRNSYRWLLLAYRSL
ncbi:hypothetical protein ACOME3_005878 [Neoechinorhynchus agilis]